MTRAESFIEKRRERLLAAGVRPDDLGNARVRFLGEGGGSCALCDHAIKYLFLLEFVRPDGSAVRIPDVGSDCITSWASSMPQSVERDAFLAGVRAMERRLAEARKAAKRNAARLSAEDRALVERAGACGAALAVSGRDIAARAKQYGGFASDRQRAYLGSLVEQAERAARPAAPERTFERAPTCRACGREMTLRHGRNGDFFGCPGYPACRETFDADRWADVLARGATEVRG